MIRVTTSEDNVINIKNKNDEMASYFLDINIRVIMTSRKSGVKNKYVHFGILVSRSLLKTINRFLKATHKAGVILDISGRLFHVDVSLQIPMQEGGFDIHLMDLPFMWGCKG
jgi:hypothetical protein